MVDAPEGVSDVIQGALPGILARAQVVVSPYPFGVSPGDKLRIVSCCSVTGVKIEIHGRAVPRGETAKPFRLDHTPSSSRVVLSEDYPMAGGFVTNLSVVATSGAPKIGQCFVMVQMVRGDGPGAFVMGTLLAGYITSTQAVGWPGSPIISSTDGEPVVRSIVGTQPANGVPIVETVPSGARWELTTFRATLTPQVGPINTSPILEVRDASGNTLIEYQSNVQMTVGVGVFGRMGWSWGLAASTAANQLVNMPMPQQVRLLAGSTIRVQNVAANEHWDAPVYSVREWQEVG